MISFYYENSAQADIERISWPLNVFLSVELLKLRTAQGFKASAVYMEKADFSPQKQERMS